ncbi:hypothetical protein C1D09_003845 [Mesorhizobium intechi]|uniref:Uncharacterized protein n=1 Tax=Mesorhizobium intechi TaxID=537601 RepID=A0A8T9AWS4_9HYPH|nr:hypothetical protein [Mesorhizobium intechi]TSE13456.1 hypothetical protein C1D09_003845 [Mesorhizobium intechi]
MPADVLTEMFKAKPLLAFSLYTQAQADKLQRMRDEIEALMADTGTNEVFNEWQRATDFFWFFTLGAYEVLRTMDQHNRCFVPLVGSKITEMKRRIAPLRMPFAKQEYQGGGGPIGGENSIVGFKNGSFQYRVGDTVFDVRETMAAVCDFLGGIKRDDVLAAMPIAKRETP